MRGETGSATGIHSKRFWYSNATVPPLRYPPPAMIAEWRNTGENIFAIGVEVALESELVPGHQVTAELLPRTETARAASSCMRSEAVRRLSLKIFSSSARLFATAAVHSVEPLSVEARVVVRSRACPFRPGSSLWLTEPTSTASWIFWSASRCLCGNSKQWSQSVTFPERTSWIFSQAKIRPSSRSPPSTSS